MSTEDNKRTYTVCKTEEDLSVAVQAIKTSSLPIVVDLEGIDLGQEGGSTSLISIQTTSDEPRTFLVDAVSLGKELLRPLFDVIESSDIQKIVFDGRMDRSALLHMGNGVSVNLTNVLDMQLADVVSRKMRGEDEDEQLSRLSPYIKRTEVFQRNGHLLYGQVQKLSGIDRVIEEHGISGVDKKSRIDHDQWSKRPIPDKLLEYALGDVTAIRKIYEFFKAEGHIGSSLPQQSSRYVTMWRTKQPKKGDAYKAHPLLPLEILEEYSSYKQECPKCERNLCQPSFSKAAWSGRNRLRVGQCWVCRAVGIHELREKNIRDAIEREWDDYSDYDSDGYGYDGYGYLSD